MSQIDRMRVFLRVAELASFTAAAQSLGMPRASVSTAIQHLEAELGARLLHRTTRRVSLTQDGQVFRERAQDLLGDLDELTGLFQREGASLRGRLRVDMPLGAARDHVIPALPDFCAAHPELELELSSTDRLVDVVREGFDCVLRVGPRGDSSLIARTLGHYRVLTCASRGYVERHGAPRSPAELAGHRLVRYATSFGGPADDTLEYVDPGDGEARLVALAGSITVNNSDAYRSACLAGLGIIQVPAVGVREHLASGALVELLPEHRPPPMPVTLLYANRRHLPRRVRVFMEWLAEVLRPQMIEGGEG
ncbi:MAG: LysR family transcriptional regulator, partial [Myxococcales bacterium]|nr:LysR family transcriptional regulator [Myxococcales bacterium]